MGTTAVVPLFSASSHCAMSCWPSEVQGGWPGVPLYSRRKVVRGRPATWSAPTCERTSTVWVPAAPSIFFESPLSGKAYWVANILPEPVYGSYPRCPLTIAELDREGLCILRHTVRTIQDMPQDAPERRRYSNFGGYVDRLTGEFVLTMPEEPRISREDYTADAIRYKIALRE